MFTVREATWACRLRHVIPQGSSDQPLKEVTKYARMYARHERAAKALDQPLDTASLDGRLAFTPWESPDAQLLYSTMEYIDRVPYLESADDMWDWEEFMALDEEAALDEKGSELLGRVLEQLREPDDIASGVKIFKILYLEYARRPEWADLTETERFNSLIGHMRKIGPAFFSEEPKEDRNERPS